MRKFFPGIVTLQDGTTSVAWTFKHYTNAEDPEDEEANMAEKTLRYFWVSLLDFYKS